MSVSPALSVIPDTSLLVSGLGSVLGREVSVLERTPFTGSTFSCERVRCRAGDTDLDLFCKYGRGHEEDAHGHKGGVPYEAEVYRTVLRRSSCPAPRWFGAYDDGVNEQTWLVLGNLAGSSRVSRLDGSAGMEAAARWLGRFQAEGESRAADPELAFLTRYDAAYYTGWAERTAAFAGSLHERFPWLERLCAGFDEAVPVLLASHPTTIHGEYYPHNVLIQDGVVHPVDWESAAIGAGEVDLAALTEGDWGAEVVERCETAYAAARWGGDVPERFPQTVAAARAYLHLRWLGDRPEWTCDEEEMPRYDELLVLGEKLGLIR